MAVRLRSLLFIFVFALSGCAAPVMKAGIDLQSDPDYQFDKNAVLLVRVLDNANPLLSQYWLSRVVNGFSSLGFKDVVTDKDASNLRSNAKMVAYFKVERHVSSFDYSSPDLGLVDTGVSNSNCVYGYSINCTTVNQKRLAVVGASKKTGLLDGRYFHLAIGDIGSRRTVLSLMVSSYESKCSDEKVYGFMIEQAFKRMVWGKPKRREFKVEMPDGYDCKE